MAGNGEEEELSLFGNSTTRFTFFRCDDLEKGTCHVENWSFGGVNGTCNVTTGICSCPPGYNGLDDFDAFNDCHIPEGFRFGLQVSAVVVTAINLILCAGFAIRLLLDWRLIYLPSKSSRAQTGNVDENTDKFPHKSKEQISPVIPETQSPVEDVAIFAPGRDSFLEPSLIHQPRPVSQAYGFMLAHGESENINNNNDNNNNNNNTGMDDMESTPAKSPAVSSHGRKGSSMLHDALDLLSSHKRQGSKDENRRASTKTPNFQMPRASTTAIKELIPYAQKPPAGPSNKGRRLDISRKRRTIFVVIMMLIFSASMFIYSALTLSGKFSRRNYDNVMNVALSFVVSFAVTGIWVLALTWFGNLPNLGTYGRLFKIDSLLIRNPNLVKYLAYSQSIVSTFLCFLLFTILPVAIPEYKYIFDTALFAFGVVEMIFFLVTFLMVCSLLLRCFDTLISNDLVQSTRKNEPVKRARQTVIFAMMSACILTPLAAIIFGGLTVSVEFRRNLWAISPLVQLGGSIVSIIILYVVVIRTPQQASSTS